MTMNNRILAPRDSDISEKDKAVAEYLEGRAIFEIHFAGDQTDADGWQHDAWSALIRREDGRCMTTGYRTGTGHRRRLRKVPEWVRKNPRTIDAVTWMARHPEYPVMPTAASVIYSLLMDEQCAAGTFADFCSGFGYDTDSRKALDTYLACQQSGEKLRAVFSSDEIHTLESILEDY